MYNVVLSSAFLNNKYLTISEDNVIELLQKHEKQEYFYSNNIDEEIEYISLHFYKLCESQRAKLKNMKEDTINKIISNNKLHLKDENQLLHFLNEIYEERKDIKSRNLYEFVIFENVYEDMIEEFITYVNKNDYSLNNEIEYSIFETNDFLIKHKDTTLIEYAAFFGSTQIFKYLYKNGAELKPNIWLYGIHSDNPEMIHLLLENGIKPPNESYERCIKESIKCHHNDITNYIQSNLINEDIPNIDDIDYTKNYKKNIYSYCFHYYNFSYFPEKINNKIIFYYACQYDYFEIVEYFLNTFKINNSIYL